MLLQTQTGFAVAVSFVHSCTHSLQEDSMFSPSRCPLALMMWCMKSTICIACGESMPQAVMWPASPQQRQQQHQQQALNWVTSSSTRLELHQTPWPSLWTCHTDTVTGKRDISWIPTLTQWTLSVKANRHVASWGPLLLLKPLKLYRVKKKTYCTS